MKFLVTGAAGFIGSHLAESLIRQGQDVVTIDNLSTGFIENIPKGTEFIRGNVFDKNIIDKLSKHKFDCIFHIAGQSSGEVSFNDPVYDLQTNAQSTLLLLDYAKKSGCNKFIYASTMSVYGDQENPLVNEENSTNPKSFYAVGKLASENYLRIYSKLGINCIALRLFNVYGVGQNLWNLKQGMLSIFLAMAVKEKKIVVKGSLNRFRDFIHVDDVVNAFIKAYKIVHDIEFDIYNISSGIKTTISQLIYYIEEAMIDNITIVEDGGTPGDQFGIYGDSNKFINQTGWRSKIKLIDGIKEMVNWAKGELL